MYKMYTGRIALPTIVVLLAEKFCFFVFVIQKKNIYFAHM